MFRKFQYISIITCIAANAALCIGHILGRWSETADAINNFSPLIMGIAASSAVIALLRSGMAMRVILIAALVAGFASGLSRIRGEYAATPPQGAIRPDTPLLRLLTHNVLVGNRDVRATVAAIARSGADIVLLQETDGNLRGALPALAAIYPYGSPCEHRCSLKILSKRPLIQTRYRLRTTAGAAIGPPLIWATTTAPDGRPVTVVSLHYPWPVPAGAQQRQRDALVQALGRIDTGDLILAGDMNLTPWTHAMQRQDAGMRPMARITRAAWSFPARLGAWRWPVAVLPIDHIYTGTGWRTVSVRTLPATGSDHLPVLATLERR